jgi:hypothetical protein
MDRRAVRGRLAVFLTSGDLSGVLQKRVGSVRPLPRGGGAEVAKFAPWQEFEVIPVIDLLESTPIAAAASEFRKSV